MPEVETSFSVEIVLRDENGQEIDLRQFNPEVDSVAALVDKGEITSFEEILGHLWMKVHFRKAFGDDKDEQEIRHNAC